MVEINVDKIKIDKFAQSTQEMDKRIARLYENVVKKPVMSHEMPEALTELSWASQSVHFAIEELYHQHEQLEETKKTLQAECKRYEELFEEAPDGYLVTDAQGKIQLANRKATKLLNLKKESLVGKPIINFVALKQKHEFRNFLTQVSQNGRSQELIIALQQHGNELFNAALTVAISYNNQGKAQTMRWLLRSINESKRAELVKITKDRDFDGDRPIHKYSKGDTIPLNTQVIWYVRQGLVKLTTLGETSEEVLVGLAVPGMVFGSYLTSLHTYQATAISDVRLVAIDVSEILASPALSYAFLPKINQRLQQTESFLVISGLRRVQDRLYGLLQLLKREIGEKVAQGTRLSVRLTHEDLANACCTTRVTVTRLLSQFKKQGKICFDHKKHIIVRDLPHIG
ncbi:transcriptional regulator [Fischerella thermalis WC1110]|nr:transcriptional regulator [Fischerella thermalis WC1110]PLZ23961.1 transcriptional regulator [Fischerella thermalis WC157]PLZ37316.1 transcriptional regulator [Fischerella thermalis WC538]PLZ46795.1 transcriptional regulator [Fischerella thermalis WC527]